MMRRISFLMIWLAGCSGDGSVQTPRPEAPESPPARVVVIGPSTAATMVSLGLRDALMGVSDYCSVEECAALPRVGGQQDPALETIARLLPELVLVQGACPLLEAWCAEERVEFVSFTTDSWGEWMEEIGWLGNRFECLDAASALQTSATTALEQVRDAAEPAVKTLLVVSRRADEASGLMVAGSNSFLSELAEVAGAHNAVGANERDYFDLNEEALVQLAPEAIIEFLPPSPNSLEVWSRDWPQLPAVQNQRVYALTEPWCVLPGPSMPATAALIRERLFDEFAPEVTE